MKKADPSVYAIPKAELIEVLRSYELIFGTDVFKKEGFFMHASCNSILRGDNWDKHMAFRRVIERIKTRPTEGRRWLAYNERTMWISLATLCAGASWIRTPFAYEPIPIPPELVDLVKL